MVKKFLAAFVFLFIIHNSSFISPVFAAGEFATSYNINYEVSQDGVTQVVEGITLRNLTNRFYASSFSLIIGATQISDIQAQDSQGPLPVSTQRQGTKTKMDIKFVNQQISGQGKEYSWTLKYKSADFAQRLGKLWQVSIPKISSTDSNDKYLVTLSVPVSFGDPASISPPPKVQSEREGKIVLNFDQNQLTGSGLSANFGAEQILDYNLRFPLVNESFLPTVIKLPLPHNTLLQNISINLIAPRPENVTLDNDGNFSAWFKVDRRSFKDIKVSGQADLKTTNFFTQKHHPLSDRDLKKYTSAQKYWEADNPLIKTKLAEIFQSGTPQTNFDKAKLIDQFVSGDLTYDKNSQRLGGVTALANPDKASCLEFSDLFITLARAAGIPTRMIVGYAYSQNQDLKPLSLTGGLHCWAQYFDEKLGWVMVDPTWEATSGGDYFNSSDLNHFAIATLGESSELPVLPNQVDVKFLDNQFLANSKLNISINTPNEIFAGFPFQAKVRVENLGNFVQPPVNFLLTSSRISLKGQTNVTTPSIPPQGFVEYNYDLRSNSLWESFEDHLQLKIGDQIVNKKIIVKPFFERTTLSKIVIGALVFIFATYLIALTLHLKLKTGFKNDS